MSEYIIEYKSTTNYTEPVSDAVFEFNVSPCQNNSQLVVSNSMTSSVTESIFNFKNLFGFEINRVKATSNFKEFTFQYKATIQKNKMKLPFSSVLSLKEELDSLAQNHFFIEHHLFLTKSKLASLTNENRKVVLQLSKYDSLFGYLTELNKYVNSLMTYQKNVTNVYTNANDAIKLKKGVCQDYVHIFIAMARQNKIPARYVSGYLNQGKKFVGTSFMHAWVEAFIPSLGWVGFDPTNKLLVDENYIKVSHGVDYNDCTPIKGVIRSTGVEDKSLYQVKVVEQ